MNKRMELRVLESVKTLTRTVADLRAVIALEREWRAKDRKDATFFMAIAVRRLGGELRVPHAEAMALDNIVLTRTEDPETKETIFRTR